MSLSQRSASLTARSRAIWWSLAVLFAIAIAARFARPLIWPSEVGGFSTQGRGGVAWSPEPPGAGAVGSAPSAPEVPDFALIDSRGRSFARRDLQGRVWIANFIFTDCPSICPALTQKMAEVRTRLKDKGADDIISVSFSVDPLKDTPSALAVYAARYGASPASWVFLTGDPQEMLRTVSQGFHLIMADPASGAPAHSNRFVVVDARGRIRSMHEGSEADVVGTVVREALALKAEGGS